jgi:glutathione S-transferase
LHEIGTPFDAWPICFKRKENRIPAYLALNPGGKVPTLLIDGRPLSEVASILFYLARRFPDVGLVPAGDPEAEAQVISWMSFIAATIHPARRRGLGHARAIYAPGGSVTGPGPSEYIRSPTFISSACTGASSIRSIRHQGSSRTWMPITSG